MAGTITRLVYQKKNLQRVNVYLDDAYAFPLPDIEAAKLKIGQHLSDADIAGLRRIDDESKAFDRAVRMLGSRPRSQAEIEARLKQAEYAPEIVQKVVKRLQSLSYLDDAAFVRWWIDNRSQFNPRGVRALRQELAQKGVDRGLIEQALTAIDEETQAVNAGRKRVKRWRHLPRPEFFKKMLGFLQRRGFNYADARAAAEELWQQFGQEANNGID